MTMMIMIQVKKRKKLFPGKVGNDSESSDDDVFYRFVHVHGLCQMIIYVFQRACDNEEDEDSSSSENSDGEDEAVLTKKSKGLNKIMDLPSVRFWDFRSLRNLSQSFHDEHSENYFVWQAMASLGMKDMRPLDDKKTGNNIN